MSRQSWPRQKALPHTIELGVRRLAHTTLWHRVVSRHRRPCMRDRPGQARATDKARLTRQTRPSADDKGARAIGEFCRDRELSVTIDLENDPKKKPRIWGVTEQLTQNQGVKY